MTKTQVIETTEVELPFSDLKFLGKKYLWKMVARPQCLFKPEKLIFCVGFHGSGRILKFSLVEFMVGIRLSLANVSGFPTVIDKHLDLFPPVFVVNIPPENQIAACPGVDLTAYVRFVLPDYTKPIEVTGSVFGQGVQ